MPRPTIRRIRARSLLIAIALVIATIAAPAVAHAATFDPLDVIPYETWRGATSLSTKDIQAFLDGQPGPLKSVVTTDYVEAQAGTPWVAGMPKKSAAQLIYEAAQRWNLNPKVIIATLQKEQSLITTSNSDNAKRLRKAMGAGVYDKDGDGDVDNQYPGLGNQIWNGARLLSTYETRFAWYPGKVKAVTAYKYVEATKTVDGKVVTYDKRVSYTKYIVPKNASTFALYTYTPYYPQKLVWDVYVRYFGDPKTSPRLRPVYRFRNARNGNFFYTQSEAKRFTLLRTSAATWKYSGVAFTIDTSSTAKTTPLFHMYNTLKGKHYYTTSDAKRKALLAVRPRQWRYDGVTCYVSKATTGTVPVYRLQNKSNGGLYFTSSASVKRDLTSGRTAAYRYLDIFFRVGVSTPTTTPVGPVTTP